MQEVHKTGMVTKDLFAAVLGLLTTAVEYVLTRQTTTMVKSAAATSVQSCTSYTREYDSRHILSLHRSVLVFVMSVHRL